MYDKENKMWYECLDKDKETLLKSLVQRKEFLTSEMSEEHEKTEDYIDFFQVGTRRSGGYGSSNFFNQSGVIAYNVILPMVEECLAKASQINTIPMFFGKNTTFLERRQARKLNSYILNMFKKGDIFSYGTQTELHSLVGNLGILKMMPDKKNKVFKFSSPSLCNIYFENPYGGKALERKEVMECQEYTTYDLKMMFPNMEKEIENMMMTMKDEKIKVYQIWYSHLACVTFCEKYILEIKKIPKLPHPYEFKVRSRPYEGMIGGGLSHRLYGYQREINRLLRKISKSIDVASYPFIFAELNSGVQRMMNNGPGNIFSYRGTPPTIQAPPGVSRDVIDMLFRTIEQAFKEARLDMNSVGGNPFGAVRSGTGLQKKLDIERSGHYNTLKDYEEMFVRMSKKMILYGNEYNIGEKGFWDDIRDLDKFLYNLQKYPMDMQDHSPQQKIATAEAVVSSGFYSPEEVLDFLGFPDHSRLFTSKLTRINGAYKMLEDALYDEEPAEPDPVLGYQEQKEIALKIYGELIDEGVDYNDEKFSILDNFLKIIKTEQDRITQERMASALANNPLPTTSAPLPGASGAPTLASGDNISAQNAREQGGSEGEGQIA